MQHDGCQCVEGERRRELAQVYGKLCERTGQSSPRRLARSPPAGISMGSAAEQISGSRRGAPRKAGTETVASSAGRPARNNTNGGKASRADDLHFVDPEQRVGGHEREPFDLSLGDE